MNLREQPSSAAFIRHDSVTKARPAHEELPTGHERVFVVDDEQLVRRTTQRLLEALGYEVEPFRDAQALIERLRHSVAASADLVLTDYNMPNCSGYQLAKHVRRTHPTLRVLLCSAMPEECIKPKHHPDYWPPFLAKPFLLTDLARKLREVLDDETSLQTTRIAS
jgi:CheY-like chemotaxis protein